jgi:hypothetical protein
MWARLALAGCLLAADPTISSIAEDEGADREVEGGGGTKGRAYDALKLCSRFMISCTSRRVLPSWMYNRTISGRNSFQGFVILENKIREANNRGRVGEPRK